MGRKFPERTQPQEYVHKDEEEAEQDHLAPSEWWFSSTMFPLIAGTFGPVASAFNICALVMDWRVIVSSSSTEGTGVDVRDPDWLDALNAISVFFSVAANFFLLAHMVGRIKFHYAQPATIICFYLSGFILIGLVAAAPSHLPLPAGEARTFSQAYYYAIITAAIEIILGSMMIATAIGVYFGKYSREFKLTFSQRTLMFQTTTFIGYIMAAGAVYSRIEGWDFLDSVYWVDVTVLTIGFGDFSPKTHLGRSLLFPMAVGGILFLGLIISSIRSLVIQGSSNKISIRMVEKARESAIAKLDTEETSIALRPWQKHYIGKDVNTELGRREQEFNLMRQVQKKSATDYHIMILALSFGTACFLWFGGAAIFQAAELNSEGWTYFESLYFTYVALLTIGYGDFYPQTNSAKPAFVFWSLIALPTLTVFIGSIGDAISDGVGNVTLWLSHHLPEGTGALRDLKGAAHKKKKGDGGAHQQAKPAGFMSHPDGTDKSGDTEAHPDHHDPSKDVIKQGGKHYKQLLIMKQMKQTIQHLDATPPRKYTYSEWCWILKLLGQDESSEEHHRSPHEVKKAQNAGELNGQTFDHGQAHAGQPESDGTVVPWSWLGHKSPLMSGIDEPKWVLDRLMDALERELHEQAHDGMDDETKANLEELHKPRNSQSSKESTKEST